MEFKDKFKEVRKTIGYKQIRFGEMLGLSQQGVSQLESGKKKPSKTLMMYLNYLYSGFFDGNAPFSELPAENKRPLIKFEKSEECSTINGHLATIEALSERSFDRVKAYIHATYDTVREKSPEALANLLRKKFYVITEGAYQIRNIFIGLTKNDVVENARHLINKWPEFKTMDNDEFIEACEYDGGNCEFDLVEIEGEWPGHSFDRSEVIALYKQQYG